jgi:hypothetical protein
MRGEVPSRDAAEAAAANASDNRVSMGFQGIDKARSAQGERQVHHPALSLSSLVGPAGSLVATVSHADSDCELSAADGHEEIMSACP